MLQQRYCHSTNIVLALLAGALAITLSGCGRTAFLLGIKESMDAPRVRMSCYATDSVGTVWGDPNELGHHCYKSGRGEGNGILYTCRAGHIDMPHVRKAADWTKYLADKAFEAIKEGRAEFSFKLYEPSQYFVTISYPPNWDQLSVEEQERIGRQVSIDLGQYLGFNASVWHEIVTWFGYRPSPWYPEFPSAFSWEDAFSNLLGVRLGAQAMRDPERSYDDAMTVALAAALQQLGVQPKEVAKQASKAVAGWWYSGKILFLVNIRKRNLDIGLDDGFVTATIVPGVAQCPNAEPASWPVPTLDVLADYGFGVRVEIEPRELLVKGRILKVVYPDRKNRPKRIEPALHFPVIMKRVRQDAIRKFGPEFYPEEPDKAGVPSVAPAAVSEQDGQ